MQTQGVSSRGRGVSPEGCAAKWSAPCWPPLEGKLWWCDDVMLWWGPARASAAVLSGRRHFPTCAKVQTMTQSMGEGNAGTQLATSTLAPVSQGWKHAPRRGSASHCHPPSPQLLPRREPRAPSAAQLSSPSRSGGRERTGGCVWSTHGPAGGEGILSPPEAHPARKMAKSERWSQLRESDEVRYRAW